MSNIFPICPVCGKGTLLPFSRGEDIFELWKCSNPECGYVVNKR
jgi:ribosomal protein S27AE